MHSQVGFDYDYLVIGSGFGGSVSALRLTEKGYRVAVCEQGKRYRTQDFPKTNWRLRRFLWAPALKLHGFFRMKLFRHVWVLSGVGVGGGSLTYANTLLVPPEVAWDDPDWVDLANWRDEMPDHYATAKRMLGVTETPYLGTADQLLKEGADRQGVGETYYRTQVGVYFGEPDETVSDPYFGGAGPDRTGCNFCGGCMAGCRYGAKNTLDKNYLYLAEQQGAQVLAERKVVDVRPLGAADGSDGYAVTIEDSLSWLRKRRRVLTARGVVFAAGVLGTVPLLLRMRENGGLPRLSPRVGTAVRTNSESIIGVRFPGRDVTDGVAIGSGIYLDRHTHVEAVRYARGSDALGVTATLMAEGRPGIARILAWLGALLRHPLRAAKLMNPIGFAKHTLILLVMQTIDGTLRLKFKRSLWPPFRRRLVTEGDPIPTYIPQANRFARQMAADLGGEAMTSITEIALNVPTTAHILGGAPMGLGPDDGVIDADNRVFGYHNMWVCDGSMIGANLGVNPSLTITALAERAMHRIPANGSRQTTAETAA